MRNSVVLTLLGAILALGGVFYIALASRSKSPAGAVGPNVETVPAAHASAIPAQPAARNPDSDVSLAVQQPVGRPAPPTQDDVTAAKAEHLMELAGSDNPGALQAIVAELNNGNPDIRKSAVEATVQLGDTNAIPWLEAAAQWTQSGDERTEILEAVEFLKLPKLENRTEGRRVARSKTVSNTVKTPKLSP